MLSNIYTIYYILYILFYCLCFTYYMLPFNDSRFAYFNHSFTICFKLLSVSGYRLLLCTYSIFYKVHEHSLHVWCGIHGDFALHSLKHHFILHVCNAIDSSKKLKNLNFNQ